MKPGLAQGRPSSGTEVSAGTVRLQVTGAESTRQIIQFLADLRYNADIRLLKMVPDNKDGAIIWLNLRTPMQLDELLLKMQGVSHVSLLHSVDGDQSGPLLQVHLVEAFSPLQNGVGGEVEGVSSPENGVVLVVEDAVDFQEAIVALLGVQSTLKAVHVASSGEEALAMLPEIIPEWVLLDFRLPGIDGLETAKRIKSQYPAVKLAFITAYADRILGQAARASEIEEVISKKDLSLGWLKELFEGSYKADSRDSALDPGTVPFVPS